MRQKHGRRIPRLDARGGLDPALHIDVGRRRRRTHVIARDADACRIADKRDAARRVEKTDVMRGVARRVRDVKCSSGNVDSFRRVRKDPPYRQRHDVRGGHGRDLAPQRQHLIAPETRGAPDQLRRIDQVRRAALVDEDFERRIPADERACHACVIQVHVRQENVRDVGETNAESIQAELERIETRCRPGIDQRDASRVTDHGGGDDVGAASEFQVDPGEAGCKDGHAERGIILSPRKPQVPSSKSQIPTFGIWGLGFGVWDSP